MSESVSELLIKWEGGEAAALDRLLPLVYNELRRLARGYLRHQKHGNTLQPTALVHEAYLRLVETNGLPLQNRAQFFGLAAAVMRNILVDHCRQKGAAKRGGEALRVSFSNVDRVICGPSASVIAIDDALKTLATLKPVHARVVEYRFFAGLTIEETAEVLDLSPATVERYWTFARAWLHRELGREGEPVALEPM